MLFQCQRNSCLKIFAEREAREVFTHVDAETGETGRCAVHLRPVWRLVCPECGHDRLEEIRGCCHDACRMPALDDHDYCDDHWWEMVKAEAKARAEEDYRRVLREIMSVVL